VRITKLRVVNYRGIESLETELSAAGAVVSGGNAKGKTTVLNAIRAALIGRGIDAKDIRLGADRAEVLVDMDALSVRRVITPKTSTVTVTNAEGFTAKKPVTFLQEIVGGAAIDPVELFLAKPAERRKQILAALPVTVTLEQLRQWAPTLPDNFDCSGHGLEVIERVRKIAYDQRTVANAAAKKAREDADRARDAANVATKGLPATPVSVSEAQAATDRAKAKVTELEARRAAVASAIARTDGARAKVAELRAAADAIGFENVDDETIAAADARRSEAERRVGALRAALAEAEAIEREAKADVDALTRARDIAMSASQRAADLRAQATTLEETIGAATPTGPTDEEIATARVAVEAAITAGAEAMRAEESQKLSARASELVTLADGAEREAARLDGMVKALANDAPAALLSTANAIAGLSLDGDDVLLDGKSIGALSGAEQLRFAVKIAKRAAGRVKILLCDGVERLDPDQMEQFVEFATDDDFQLLCTRVERGEMTVEAIEREIAEAAE
jgi:hypothetical protein